MLGEDQIVHFGFDRDTHRRPAELPDSACPQPPAPHRGSSPPRIASGSSASTIRFSGSTFAFASSGARRLPIRARGHDQPIDRLHAPAAAPRTPRPASRAVVDAPACRPSRRNHSAFAPARRPSGTARCDSPSRVRSADSPRKPASSRAPYGVLCDAFGMSNPFCSTRGTAGSTGSSLLCGSPIRST